MPDIYTKRSNVEAWRAELIELVKACIADIHADARAPGCEDDDEPSMQLTVATDDELSGWNYQTGDNSFTGGAYGLPHWAVIYLTPDSDPSEIVSEIFGQWAELIAD